MRSEREGPIKVRSYEVRRVCIGIPSATDEFRDDDLLRTPEVWRFSVQLARMRRNKADESGIKDIRRELWKTQKTSFLHTMLTVLATLRASVAVTGRRS